MGVGRNSDLTFTRDECMAGRNAWTKGYDGAQKFKWGLEIDRGEMVVFMQTIYYGAPRGNFSLRGKTCYAKADTVYAL